MATDFRTINGEKKVFFGTKKNSGEKIYISKPSWDCNWYWGFGYLGNRNCHYHLDGYQNGRNINMYDALLKDYDLNPSIEENLFEFCELVLTAYTLKKTAEVLGRGGSNMTTNPLADEIKNVDEVKRINEVLLPKIFNELNKIYEVKIATIKKENFLDWYINSGSDQEQKENKLHFGTLLEQHLLNGNPLPTVDVLWDSVDKSTIPAKYFNEYSDDNDDEIGEYGISKYKLIK